MKKIDYFMENTVNGEKITLIGGGNLSEEGVMNMEIEVSKVPKWWNPIFSPCICSGPGPGPVHNGLMRSGGLIKYAPKGYMTTPGKLRRAVIIDASGETIGIVNATGLYAQDENGLTFKIKVDTKVKPDSIIPTITKIDHYSFTIEPLNAHQVKVYCHYSLSNDKNEKVHGWTQIFYDLIDVKDAVPYSIVGRNVFDISFAEKMLKYTSKQTARSEYLLGNAEAIKL